MGTTQSPVSILNGAPTINVVEQLRGTEGFKVMYRPSVYSKRGFRSLIVTANPSDIELDEAPFPQEWVLAGTPQSHAKVLAHSNDQGMSVIVWSCTPGQFRWEYDVDEVVHILSGEVVITDHSGRERRLCSGDTAFFPAGSCSVWHVQKAVRKLAVCRNAVPRIIELGLTPWRRLRKSAGMLRRQTRDLPVKVGILFPIPLELLLSSV